MSVKRLFLALLFLPSLAGAAKIVSQQTGNWGDGTTWVGGVVPGNHDEVSIFHVISATDTRTIGVSVTSGSIAINLNSTGTIHITSTGHLIQRGYGTYTASSSNLTDAVDVDGGGAWEFDASASTSPTTIHYGFYPSTSNGYRKFKISGSAGSYASIYNTVTSTVATLTQNGQAAGGVYELLYASVTRMGFDLSYNNNVSSVLVKWDAQHSSFTNCAIINTSGNMYSGNTFRHEYNYHVGSWGSSVFNMNITSHIDDSAVRSIKGNVFDILMNTLFLGAADFTFQDNFMGAGYSASSSSWTLFTNNFVRMDNANANTGVEGIFSDSYVWWDEDRQNTHVFTTGISSAVTFSGVIYGQSGRSKTTGSDDSGEFWLQSGPTIVATATITNSIFLLNGAGYQGLEVTSLLGSANTATYLSNRFVCEHNTYGAGWDNGGTFPPFAMVDYSETANMSTGTLASFRDNLLWNPGVATQPAQFYKLLDVGNVSSNLSVGFQVGPTTDVCNPSNCDYNAAYQTALSTATGSNTFRFLNQGKGYGGNWSVTPGAHDISGQNPNFVDYHRYVEAFDSSYWRPHFGISQPTAWNPGATYSQGDVVSHSSSTYYWGDTLNYVYISSGFCVSPNPEPGVIPISTWNKCWKFQSIEDIKSAIASSMTITDATIGATNASVNQVLLKWVRAGYAPTNIAYKGTAHDGTDIGAVTANSPGSPVISPSTSVVSVGGSIQFTSTNTVTWSLKAGSMGSINSAGLYTAPATYFRAKNISPAGCLLRPNDDIVNTRIDNLPVDSSSTFRFAHEFTVNGGSNAITFEPTMPTNIYNSGTPTQTMTFRSTTGDNGLFPMLSSATRMEEGSSIPDAPAEVGPDQADHHILGVDSNTCTASEQYDFYPAGTDPVAPNSNSGAGFQYATNWYKLPDRSTAAGGTDAAGMAIQPLLLRYSELKSGRINHALRFTLNNANIWTPADNGWDWPATDQAFHNNCTGGSRNCFHYGARIRLKSTYNCAGFSSAGSQAICTALQQYGGFLTDGSNTKWGISANYDLVQDTTAFNDIFAILQSSITTSNLEQVDESSLMVSSFTGIVNPSNPYVTPDNFAQVIATNIDGSTSTISIAIQPAIAGFANPAYPGLDTGINVMAGTPQFQIPYWVSGAADATAACTMTPVVGTLTSDCKYTAPTNFFNRMLVSTVTITSNIDPNHASVSFYMTIFSSDGIRVRAGPAISGSDTRPPYDTNGNYTDPLSGSLYFEEPANMVPNWNQRTTQGSALWPLQLYNNHSYGSGDKVFSAMVPSGNYTFQLNTGAGNCCGDVATSSNSIESQGIIFQPTVSLAPSAFATKVIASAVSVGTAGSFYWAIRGNVQGSHNFYSYFTLLPAIATPVSERLQGFIRMQGQVQMR